MTRLLPMNRYACDVSTWTCEEYISREIIIIFTFCGCQNGISGILMLLPRGLHFDLFEIKTDQQVFNKYVCSDTHAKRNAYNCV